MREQLVAVAERRDRTAFSELFEYLAPRFKSFALARGFSDRQAEEVVQDAMLAVWTRAASFKPELAAPMTWFFTIARNKCTDLFRREGRTHAELDDEAEQPEDEGRGPEALYLAGRARELLDAALGRLSGEQRSVVQKAFFEDMTQTEVAEALGIPLGTVKSRLRLAYERLRAELREQPS